MIKKLGNPQFGAGYQHGFRQQNPEKLTERQFLALSPGQKEWLKEMADAQEKEIPEIIRDLIDGARLQKKKGPKNQPEDSLLTPARSI